MTANLYRRDALKVLGAAAFLGSVLGCQGRANATPPTSISTATCASSGTLGPWQTYGHANFGDLAHPDVVIVGDSITARGHDELATVLQSRGRSLAGSYWSGRPLTPAVDWALSLSVPPPVLVMASGTNDIFNPSVVATQAARLKSWAINRQVRLIWVTVYAARSSSRAADLCNSQEVNRQIKAAGVEVCDWYNWFATKPSREALYLEDGVHPIEGVGTSFWAAVLNGSI